MDALAVSMLTQTRLTQSAKTSRLLKLDFMRDSPRATQMGTAGRENHPLSTFDVSWVTLVGLRSGVEGPLR